MDLLKAIGNVASGVSPFISAGIKYIQGKAVRKSTAFSQTYKYIPNSSSGSGDSGSGGSGSSGSGSGTDDGSGGSGDGTSGDGTTSSTDNTAENVKKNDPEKNKTLAEIRMSEELRNTFSLTVKMPRILEKIHTNQFFWLEVTDDFYDKNYPT